MFFIFAWCSKDETSFNEAVPLDLLAESYLTHGSTIPITVVFLEGYATLSRSYRDKLGSMGLLFADFTEEFRAIKAEFPNLIRFYSQYEQNCYLRWIAFQRLHERMGRPRQVWHLDGDIILHTSTDAIAEDTAGKTFVLQGCPVLTSISDPQWFSIYARELREMERDIQGYSRKAQAMKAEISPRDRELCNVTPYPDPMMHDQDLLEYLISAEILMQDKSERVFDSRFYFIQNALAARYWDDLQVGDYVGRVVGRSNGELHYGSKTIPFVHYQNNFSQYCAIYLAFSRVGLGWLTPSYTNPRTAGEIGLPFKATSRALAAVGMKMPTRREVIRSLGGPREPFRLAEIINHINFRGPAHA